MVWENWRTTSKHTTEVTNWKLTTNNSTNNRTKQNNSNNTNQTESTRNQPPYWKIHTTQILIEQRSQPDFWTRNTAQLIQHQTTSPRRRKHFTQLSRGTTSSQSKRSTIIFEGEETLASALGSRKPRRTAAILYLQSEMDTASRTQWRHSTTWFEFLLIQWHYFLNYVIFME